MFRFTKPLGHRHGDRSPYAWGSRRSQPRRPGSPSRAEKADGKVPRDEMLAHIREIGESNATSGERRFPKRLCR